MPSATLIVQYLGQGLAANRPATPNIDTGALAWYYATDTKTMSVWENGAWATFTSGIDLFNPPSAASFPTIINGDSVSPPPSVTDTSYGMLFDSGATTAVGDRIRGAFQNVPNASTFTTVIGFRKTQIPQQYRSIGLFVTDGTKYMCVHQIDTDLQVNKFTNATTFSSAPVTINNFWQEFWYMKVQATGGNLIWSISNDGRNWIQLFSEAIGAFLSTITQVGIAGDIRANTGLAAGDHIFANVFYWSSTNP